MPACELPQINCPLFMFCYSNIFVEIHIIIIALLDDRDIRGGGMYSMILMSVVLMQTGPDPSGI